MKIAILGYAGQGKSSYEYWNDGTNYITICDRNTELQLPSDVKTKLGDEYLSGLSSFDLIVRTPSVHPRDILAANADDPAILEKVSSNTNEFMRICPTRNVMGITGTKGKGTTSTLVTKILEAAGKKVHLGGNIGTPPLDLLANNISPEDYVVLELANFQLIDLKYSPPLAAVLMVEPEHLDWHADMQEYIQAKQQLFAHQKTSDTAIYYGQNDISTRIAAVSRATKIPFMKPPGAEVLDDHISIDGNQICHVSELKMLGKHNWQNACAATTVAWQVTKDVAAIRSALTSFSGLPFRIELRREVSGIKYFNDSFATGGGATTAAIHSIPEMKVLIIGGFDRHLDLTNFANAVNEASATIRKILLIGQSGQRMSESLNTAGFTNYVLSGASTMLDIVSEANALAQPGDAVVLSPGFASFDMFKNFEERGILYNQAVAKL